MADTLPETASTGWQQSLYDELHNVATQALASEKPGHSLQPTLLVNDAYLRLQKQGNLHGANRSQVLAAGANIIRRLIIDHYRRSKARKRGGNVARVSLQPNALADPKAVDLLDLDEALDHLESEHARAAAVVNLRFFGGLSAQEVAQQLDISVSTVGSDWRFARAWLFRRLSLGT